MKAVSKVRSSRPKYNSTWDVATVLSYLESLDLSSLENLTLKTVMLLALSTAQRAQTLCKIRLENIKFVPDGAEIFIPDNLKTSGIGKFQPVLQLPWFYDKPSICVVSAIKLYMDRTSSI